MNNSFNNFNYTLNGFSTLLTASIKMQAEEVYESTPDNLPILMLSGSEDPVGSYSRDLGEICDTYRKHNVKHITVKIYDGARHNVIYEINKEEIMKDCIQWVADQIKKLNRY